MPPRAPKSSRPNRSESTSTDSSSDTLPLWYMGKYQKLVNRFFESLLLLEAMGKFRGDRSLSQHDPSPRGIRRQFRNDLAFLCEYKKGGDACTSIACEDRPEATVYWVASNTETRKIASFLTYLLSELKSIRLVDANGNDERLDQLIDTCIEYSKPKINTLRNFLNWSIDKCLSALHNAPTTSINEELVAWLQQLKEAGDLPALCRFAYSSRTSSHVRRLRELARENEPTTTTVSSQDGPSSSFSGVRHYLGRLCEFVRVPKRLVTSYPYVADLLSDVIVQPIDPPPESVPAPRPASFSLDSICKKILPANSAEIAPILESLEEMDRLYHILDAMKGYYANPSVQPQVHAEIQVLETFHEKKLKWVDNDRYVGCSKPACFCCKLYFRYHPLRPVEPDSHERVYHKWGPIKLSGVDDSRYINQRNILNRMVDHIRDEALDQLRQPRGPHPWHADSFTNITENSSIQGHQHIPSPGLPTIEEDSDTGTDSNFAASTVTQYTFVTSPVYSVEDSLVDDIDTLDLDTVTDAKEDVKEDSNSDSDGGAPL